ncbi:unnamed protein product [Urochloa decumbens]|uniref:Uncharacterized protein n=1 Tax=Urochloa decumbens TaxID=240449 RepID=A0ABC9DMN8_9POAL
MALDNNSPVQRAPSVSDSPPTPAITPIAAPASSQPPAIPGAAVQPATPPAVPDPESENRHDPKAFLRDPMMSCARLKS